MLVFTTFGKSVILALHKNFIFMGDNPNWARASSLLRFRDYTQTYNK